MVIIMNENRAALKGNLLKMGVDEDSIILAQPNWKINSQN